MQKAPRFELKPLKWYVKIVAGQQRAAAKTIYYRNELSFSILTKWKWFFEYRAALYRVKNPRHFIELSLGSYEYKLTHRKGKLTEYNTKLRMAKETWSELFPIEDDHFYKKAIAKIEKYESEYKELEQQLKLITS